MNVTKYVVLNKYLWMSSFVSSKIFEFEDVFGTMRSGF
jgi:hypothetical protein